MKNFRYRILFYLTELVLLGLLLIVIGTHSGPSAVFDICAGAILTHLGSSMLNGVLDGLLRWRTPSWHSSMKKTGDMVGWGGLLIGVTLAGAYAYHAASALLFFGVGLMLLAVELLMAQRDALHAEARS